MTEPDHVPEQSPAGHGVPAEEDWDELPSYTGKPPFEYHDAEALLPPPVSGSLE